MADERKALVVGINEYQNVSPLVAAVPDAKEVAARLEFHAAGEGKRNYFVNLKVGDGKTAITRAGLRAELRALFEGFEGDALFYFAGHGALESTGAYLVTSDGARDDWGVSMQEVVDIGLGSEARSITILLDCCHSGNLGSPAALQSGEAWRRPLSVLRRNMTVIAGSLDTQAVVEAGGHGLFTAALLDALDGAAADILGEITTSSLYAHIERRFTPWQQRPVAKSYITTPTLVRKCPAKLSVEELLRLPKLFSRPDAMFPMEPDHDPKIERPGEYEEAPDKAKIEVGELFKKYRDAGLLRPTKDGEQLYWTAQLRHTAELTLVGREYWALAKQKGL